MANLNGQFFGAKSYNLLDGLGSLRVTIDGNSRAEDVVDYFVYGDPFGSLDFDNSSDGKKPDSNPSDRFTGEQLDSTGLYYLRARYSDPTIGRLTQKDSYSGNIYDPTSLNRYVYANNNPTTKTDPSGHCAFLCAAAIGVALDFGIQYIGNAIGGNFNPLDVNWGEVGLAAATGGIATEATADIRAGLAVTGLDNIIGGRAAGAVAGAAGNALAGAFYRQGSYALQGGQGLAPDLFDPGAVATDAAIGGLFGALEPETGAAGTSCGIAGNSFVAGTLVDSENGLVPIETLKIGDKVWAEDPQTGQSGYYPITFTTNHTASEVVQVTVSSGQSDNSLNLALGILTANRLGSLSGSSSGPGPNQSTQETIEATPAHPFWVVGKGWVNAGDLKIGDKLLTKDGKVVYVTGTQLVKKQAQVYNFTVDTLHTYFVGKQEWLVHNVSGACDVRDENYTTPDHQLPSGDPGMVLQDLTNQANKELSSDLNVAKNYLSGPEYAKGQTEYWIAPMNYGKTIERMVRDKIETTPAYDDIFSLVGGPNKPDFVGKGSFSGMNFDITTEKAIKAHNRRWYGKGLIYATYKRVKGFKLFP